MSAPLRLDEERERREIAAFEEWRAASERAQATLSFDDARAAGRAWRRYLDLFESPSQRAVSRLFDKTREPKS